MQAKSQAILTGETVYRWFVKCDDGWKITWAPTAEAAKAKAEQRRGVRVYAVKPSGEIERPPR